MQIDVAVIGAGPAGLSAAINLKILNKSVQVYSVDEGSDKLKKAPKVLNYLGVNDVSGQALNDDFLNHAKSLGIIVNNKKVNAVYPLGDGFMLDFGDSQANCSAVILACGLPSTASIKNEDVFLGKGVSYCATCDAPLYKGKTACVIGYDEESVLEANYVSELCSKVFFVPMAKFDGVIDKSVEVKKVVPIAFDGQNKATVLNCKDDEQLFADIFFVLKPLSADKLLAGLTMNGGTIVTDKNMATNINGVFACGDVAGKPFKYQKSAGEGQIAAFAVAEYLASLKK